MSAAIPSHIRYLPIKVPRSNGGFSNGGFSEGSTFVKSDGIWKVNVTWSEMNTLPFPWAYAVTKSKDIALTDLVHSGIDIGPILADLRTAE